jgi:ABC-2 type transport system permease protein
VRFALLIALKDLRILLRDPMALFWVLGFPVLFALFFGAILDSAQRGAVDKLDVALVHERGSHASDALVRGLLRSEVLNAEVVPLDEARDRVRTAEAAAYLRIRGAGPSVEIGVDPSRAMEQAILQNLVTSELAGRSSRFELSTVSIAARGKSGFEIVFPAAILWGLIGCAAVFAISMVSERTAGTYARLRASPRGSLTILGGKALACFMACTATASILILFGGAILHLGVARPGSLLLAILSIAACFTGITMALSVLGRSEHAVSGAGWSALVLLAMLGGAMVPASLMPEWLEGASELSPVRWGILALEGALWRGFDLEEMMLPVGVLLFTGSFAFSVGALVLHREEE